MKTEKEYADEVFSQYYDEFNFDETYNGSKRQSIQCAINDVTNTIKALMEMPFKSKIEIKRIAYYQTVLQILKERL